MMKINLEPNDFLTYQLFKLSKNELIQKKKNRSHLLLSICLGFLACYFGLSGHIWLGIYLLIFTLIILGYYKKYFNWRYKKHFTKHIESSYGNAEDHATEIEIRSQVIQVKDKTGSGKFQLNEVKSVSDLPEHYFINFKSGTSLILPKEQLENEDELIRFFRERNWDIENERGWKW